EYEEYYLVQIPLPGFSKEDVEISLISDNINIKAKKPEAYKETDKRVNKEASRSPEVFFMGNFLNMWNKDIDFDVSLPSDVNLGSITPKLTHGLLKIKVDKKPPKNIDIDE
ncbi:MAG: Hsp20/alpha crystallin family protein, partial [Promethearchaeota archaeon]